MRLALRSPGDEALLVLFTTSYVEDFSLSGGCFLLLVGTGSVVAPFFAAPFFADPFFCQLRGGCRMLRRDDLERGFTDDFSEFLAASTNKA